MIPFETDNTVLVNGLIKNGKFFPKKNLPSGTLRIVLTTECNYRCIYCFAEGEKNKKIRFIDFEELKKILLIAKEFGITNIKLTGGEPLLYEKIEELLRYIRKIKIPYIDLTSNISCLNFEKVQMLNRYNVNAVTLSLNTLKKEKLQYLNRINNYDTIIENLNLVIEKFTGKIRINCIIFDEMYKEEDYDDIVEFCKKRNLGLRLIEPSIVEGLKITYKKDKFNEYIKKIKSKADKIIISDCKSVEYIFIGNWYFTIMYSLCDNKLCSSCKEYMYIRLTSDKKLKPCLSRIDTEIEINTIKNDYIRKAFIEAISNMGNGI